MYEIHEVISKIPIFSWNDEDGWIPDAGCEFLEIFFSYIGQCGQTTKTLHEEKQLRKDFEEMICVTCSDDTTLRIWDRRVLRAKGHKSLLLPESRGRKMVP